MIRKEGLYLGWRWSQASGAVAGRCSGEATRCRQIGVLRLGSDGVFSAKKGTEYCQLKISTAPPLHGEVSKTCKKPTARWPTTTYISTPHPTTAATTAAASSTGPLSASPHHRAPGARLRFAGAPPEPPHRRDPILAAAESLAADEPCVPLRRLGKPRDPCTLLSPLRPSAELAVARSAGELNATSPSATG